MITAHLPAGYVAARLGRVEARGPFRALIFASILPDFDLIWFYFVDDRAFHHHHYWVHIPGFWLIVAAVVLPILRTLRPDWLPAAYAFFAGILLHLVLDTIAGSVAWAWPFDPQLYQFVTVPAAYPHWILSFLLHWTFAIELAIWFAAIALILGARRARAASGG
ncbi:MAG: metal-dependent hydrolase [Rhodobacteraceae bacterium]|nr:metal-dependent hydrolase [Paracoccaceae bacterium]